MIICNGISSKEIQKNQFIKVDSEYRVEKRLEKRKNKSNKKREFDKRK